MLLLKGLVGGLGARELDVLAFDGHWMACIEAAAEFESTADLMVASQGRMESWNYRERFSELLKKPDSDADDLAAQLLKADGGVSGTSILDLGEVSNVLFWTEALLKEARLYCKDKNSLNDSAGVAHFKDLPSVLEQFQKKNMPGPLKEMAIEAEDALEGLILAHCPLPNHATQGLNVAMFYEDPEDGQAFKDNVSWERFLKVQRVK